MLKRYDVNVEQIVDEWWEPLQRRPFVARVHQHPIGGAGLWNPLDKTKRFKSRKRREKWIVKMQKRFLKTTYSSIYW